MKRITMLRVAQDETKTHGVFVFNSEVVALSLELGWFLNRADVSCIPTGDYFAQWMPGRNRFEVKNVPGRALIRIHPGNVVDPGNKFKSDDSDGCIIPGEFYEYEKGKGIVRDSRDALNRLHALLGDDEFVLRVREAM